MKEQRTLHYVWQVSMEPTEEALQDQEEDEEDEDYDSEDTWESDVESEAEIAEIMQLDIAEENANSGKKEYLAKCAGQVAG